MKSKILILDIETAPNLAYVWGAWKQNIGQNQWNQKGHIMSYSAKWLGDKDVMYMENRTRNDYKIVKALFGLLDNADIVVAHNGKKFDLPTILGRGIAHGFAPPSPYHIIDTLLIARRRFRFVSNTLANIADELGVDPKDTHKKFPGFELWLECLRNNDEAWEEMRHYNIQDVVTLEEIYERMLPYIDNHPNVGMRQENGVEVVCPKCGNSHIQYRGWYTTSMGLAYRKFQCQNCGGWGRHRFKDKDILNTDGRNAV